MMRDRGWDNNGQAAREADALALTEREPVKVPYEERERRNYWRLVAQGGGPQGSNRPRHGYLAPGQNVPGATPSDDVKGEDRPE